MTTLTTEARLKMMLLLCRCEMGSAKLHGFLQTCRRSSDRWWSTSSQTVWGAMRARFWKRTGAEGSMTA